MKLSTLLLATLLPIGCDQAGRMTAAVTGDLVAKQVAEFQAQQRDGRLRDIANATVVDCRSEPVACGKLHGMRANACLTLAMQSRSTTLAACPPASAEVRAWLDCAASEYAAAEPMLATDSRPGALANRSAALYCAAEANTVAAGLDDAREAEAAGTRAATPAGRLWAGRAALFQARAEAGSDPQRCAAAGRAETLAAAAQSGAGAARAKTLGAAARGGAGAEAASAAAARGDDDPEAVSVAAAGGGIDAEAVSAADALAADARAIRRLIPQCPSAG